MNLGWGVKAEIITAPLEAIDRYILIKILQKIW